MSQVSEHYLVAPYPANRERRSHKQLTLVRRALPYNDMNQRTVLVSTFFVLISSVYISSFFNVSNLSERKIVFLPPKQRNIRENMDGGTRA